VVDSVAGAAPRPWHRHARRYRIRRLGRCCAGQAKCC